MSERVTVYVNDTAVSLPRGLRVRHALLALEPAWLEAVDRGTHVVEDHHGFLVGLDGALEDDAKLFVKPKMSHPSRGATSR